MLDDVYFKPRIINHAVEVETIKDDDEILTVTNTQSNVFNNDELINGRLRLTKALDMKVFYQNNLMATPISFG